MSLPQRHARSGSKDASKTVDPSTPPEYPRPTATTEGEATANSDVNAEQQQQQDGGEEQQNKKDKNKRAEFNQDHTHKRDAVWADNQKGGNTRGAFGGAGRVNQPAGKSFGN
ncbi:hypothetical protein CPB86DRAFT_814891 [Serendipita vermifera]|nr:hypothetical protein CPB86DRAFT_814891 [Serendipita vermifera]